MDNIVFNKNVALLQERYHGRQLIPLKEAAEYCGADPRALEALKGFPMTRLGNHRVVPLVSLAMWLTTCGV